MMSTIPILKPFNLSKLNDHFPDMKVVTEFPQLVQIPIAGVTAQAYRIDLAMEDQLNHVWNVFIYVSKGQDFLFGIDNTSGSIGRTREYVNTYDSPFASLISHFDGYMEYPRFGDAEQTLHYPEMLRNHSFYVQDVLYVATREVYSAIPQNPPGRLYEPRVDANDEERHQAYLIYPSGSFLKLMVLE